MTMLGQLFLLASLTLATPPTGTPEKQKLRVGHFPNLTHAQGVIGHALTRAGKGWFEERLGPNVEIEWYVYNAGPTAMEAMLAGSIELTYVGPNPALNAYIRSEGDEIRIVAGAASGGAALVVQPDGRIQKDADFKGRRIATPQLGNTQDVAARAFLKSKGFKITQTGGDALVLPTANADQLALFQKGDLDAVWTVEPWVTRLELEAQGKVYLEEKALWPETQGRYVTTHLVSSVAFLAEEPELLRRFVTAHVELTDWINAHPDGAKRLLNAEIEAETSKGIPAAVLERAWGRIEITHDPVSPSLRRSAKDAHAAGFLEKDPDLSRIYALDTLNQVLGQKGRPGVL
jgi:NitT/TauT family transport system substrate-binding protein